MSKGKDQKPHIGIFGRRNNGKSSLINCLSDQETAIVSSVAGTTTDPVKKSMEIPGIGAVVLIDTAGIDDLGDLGEKRIDKTLQVIQQIDMAVLVITNNQWAQEEQDLMERFHRQGIPSVIVQNKIDIYPVEPGFGKKMEKELSQSFIDFSCQQPDNLELLIEEIRKCMPKTAYQANSLVGDLIKAGETVVLVTPIDDEAPEGRLILPQVQLIRDVLDHDAVAVLLKERELDEHLKQMFPKPSLVVTDSQVFLKVDSSVPKDIPMTSFSIVLARQKGNFQAYIKGTPYLGKLKDGDRVLLLESCTHHVSCDDIGRVKIPRWLDQFSGKKLEYTVVSGLDKLPRKITDYAIVIQCGGCVITRKQVQSRIQPAIDAGVPVTNYGMTIAFVQGIFQRAIMPFQPSGANSLDSSVYL